IGNHERRDLRDEESAELVAKRRVDGAIEERRIGRVLEETRHDEKARTVREQMELIKPRHQTAASLLHRANPSGIGSEMSRTQHRHESGDAVEEELLDARASLGRGVDPRQARPELRNRTTALDSC